uniref:(northern house mosquito) hypothetical protein n=1 Tax=Culex pipiens TaxID=7175 RepID=A0A8D8BY12_CULPI
MFKVIDFGFFPGSSMACYASHGRSVDSTERAKQVHNGLLGEFGWCGFELPPVRVHYLVVLVGVRVSLLWDLWNHLVLGVGCSGVRFSVGTSADSPEGTRVH